VDLKRLEAGGERRAALEAIKAVREVVVGA
jgi:hypothetical protein